MAYPDTTQFKHHPLNRRRTHWQDWLIVLLAAWLFISPWVLGFGGVVDGGTNAAGIVAAGMPAAGNAWVLGAIIFLLSLSAVSQFTSGSEWINVLLGIWVFIAPWVLRFAGIPAASWNHWIVGGVIVILGLWRLSSNSPTWAPAE